MLGPHLVFITFRGHHIGLKLDPCSQIGLKINPCFQIGLILDTVILSKKWLSWALTDWQFPVQLTQWVLQTLSSYQWNDWVETWLTDDFVDVDS